MKFEDWRKFIQKENQKETKMSDRKEYCIIVHVHTDSTESQASALGQALGDAVDKLAQEHPTFISFVHVLVAESTRDKEQQAEDMDNFFNDWWHKIQTQKD